MAAASVVKENTFSDPSSPVAGISAPFSPGTGHPASPNSNKPPKIPTKVKQEPPPPASSPEKGTLPPEVIEKVKQKSNEPVDLSKSNNNNEGDDKDGDVPPGMVRGPNGQLWPAWVFCTRYSDRPSSGE